MIWIDCVHLLPDIPGDRAVTRVSESRVCLSMCVGTYVVVCVCK